MCVFYLTWIALGLGAAAATAALYGHYRVLPAWLTGPEVCLMEDGGCAVLFRSPRSRLLGVPNALLGVTLYVLLAIGLLRDWPAWLLFVMTLPAVAMSVVLGHGLITRKLQCRICWTGHLANAILAVIFGFSAFHLKVEATSLYVRWNPVASAFRLNAKVRHSAFGISTCRIPARTSCQAGPPAPSA